MRGCSRIGYGAEGARHQVPLRDLLQLDDETVEVVRYENFYAAGHDDASEELKFLTRHSAAVVTLTAVETRSQVAKSEEWVESTMTVHRITQHR